MSYAKINGLQMYYEDHGSGPPLLLLHGGLTTIESSVGTLIPQLSQTHRIIAPEQQAHGHTADIDRPLSFEQMADDTAALVRHLGIDRAAVFGYSAGGNVALGLAIRHQELLTKLVVASTHFNDDGLLSSDRPRSQESQRGPDAHFAPRCLRKGGPYPRRLAEASGQSRCAGPGLQGLAA